MSPEERQPYVRPELRTYGAITRLVQGASMGLIPDGMGTMRMLLG
jgi:hypothetical protein